MIRKNSLITLLTLCMPCSAQLALDRLYPDPALSPEDVVHVQVMALGQNDVPHVDAGIEIAYRFASPANRQSTGPLDRFTQLLETPMYSPLLDHHGASFQRMELIEDYAEQRVVVRAPDGRRFGYVFSLSRQGTGDFEDCWMTDAVVPFPVHQGEVF